MVTVKDFLNRQLHQIWNRRFGRSCPAYVANVQSLRVYLLWDFPDDKYMNEKWKMAARFVFQILEANKGVIPDNIDVTRVVTPLGAMGISEYRQPISNRFTINSNLYGKAGNM